MALSRKMFYFILALFFILAELPTVCQAGLDYSQSFPAGEFAVCEPCKLGRGKCRKVCMEDEKIDGRCKLNRFCCRRRV
ncbi:PREDICTED: beta-defensin 105-like [Galeopterus variegatus]|uniref:Beta-defensin n=1 Tax=Galeopterus variegatus TaxID=482537 RepID=A0ABM0S430_GALVR|nr:PREDICTED: beta-defensin 105-like [Galeopterus variegatus]